MAALRTIGKLTSGSSVPRLRARSSAAALERIEALSREVEDLSFTGSFVWRVATGQITGSDQLYRIFELGLELPVTWGLIEARVHPDDRPLLRSAATRAALDGTAFECQFRAFTSLGRLKHLMLRAHGTRDAAGTLEYIGAVQDVTRLRTAEAALSKATSELVHVNRVMRLGALSASIAHELRQPLSGVTVNAGACLKLLSAKRPDIAAARETALRALRDGFRASAVITQLQALFAKKSSKWESVDLNEAVREIIALSRLELLHKRVVVQTELAEGLPALRGDRVQLQQVILNLLLNAADAMMAVHDRPRTAMIRTEMLEEGSVCLRVQDTGPGIEPHVMARLCEPFFTTKSQGMGIGLFVCQSVIESHRGWLNVKSNDGSGATFSVTVPCASAARPSEGRS